MHGEEGLPRGSVEHLEAKSVRVSKFRSVGPTVDFFLATMTDAEQHDQTSRNRASLSN